MSSGRHAGAGAGAGRALGGGVPRTEKAAPSDAGESMQEVKSHG